MRKIMLLLTFLAFTCLNYCHHANAQPPEIQGENYPVFPEGEKMTYFVKIGNTISKLEDKEGYIIAAKRLGMESIMIIPDGKVYRTVSLDLHKDDETLKNAIEVKLDEIIVAN